MGTLPLPFRQGPNFAPLHWISTMIEQPLRPDPKTETGGDTTDSPVNLLEILGPGLITGAADDDPSGIATYSQTGAQFGYGQLWVILFTLPLMTAIQEACARIGLVTGKGLIAVARERYGAV